MPLLAFIYIPFAPQFAFSTFPLSVSTSVSVLCPIPNFPCIQRKLACHPDTPPPPSTIGVHVSAICQQSKVIRTEHKHNHSLFVNLRLQPRGMSCNGCRVLRKGCSESCILRPCLQWIESPEAQGHATVFVAKFFGRAGLMSFISNVPESQRPALFQSLLFEACGRTVNPVNGAVGLLWTGNWHLCQAAVVTVLRGGVLRPMPELLGLDAPTPATDEASEAEVTCADMLRIRDPNPNSRFTNSRSNKISSSSKRKRSEEFSKVQPTTNLDLRLTPIFLQKVSAYSFPPEIRRPGTPSMNSEESVTTTACLESGQGDQCARGGEPKVLNLFV